MVTALETDRIRQMEGVVATSGLCRKAAAAQPVSPWLKGDADEDFEEEDFGDEEDGDEEDDVEDDEDDFDDDDEDDFEDEESEDFEDDEEF